ncbi:hypothetical protein [Thiomicrorhabdus sp.]|uniref:hypothetical protein n=1 Tax=Thiomicrorhabdus sp. TaxID=2039724 RepID=UPI0029C852AE|nr:hypothetical protein [Thiomicrorhabdus sp.]
MVRRLLFLCLFSVLSWSVQAAEVGVQPNHLMMGEPVKMVLKSDHLQALIQRFNWQEIEDQFAVEVVSESEKVLRLHLYPYRAGPLLLHEQKFANFHLPETEIFVRPNPEVDIQWQAPAERVYEGQNALWKAKVKLLNPAYRAEFAAYQGGLQFVNLSQIEVQLPQENFLVGSGQAAVFSAAYHWREDLQSGSEPSIKLFSPQLAVLHQAIQPWKFFDRPRKVSIQPLPSFLPSSVWIGDLQWYQQPLGRLVTKGDLLHLRWRLSSQQIDPQTLQQGLQLQLDAQRNTESIEWFSPSYRSEYRDGVGSLLVEWPLRFRESGSESLPQMYLTYFDPDSGKLERIASEEQRFWVLPFWSWFVIDFLLGLFALSTIVLLWVGLYFWLQKKWLLHRIGRAESVEALWALLKTWPCRVTGEKVDCTQLSLMLWYALTQKITGKTLELDELNAALNRVFYAQKKQDRMEDLRLLAEKWCRRTGLWNLLVERVRFFIAQLWALKGLIKRRYFP